eukprot:TRINITY_DN16220_c0_g2_i1.p1 TRINITY_DN16220_c0_g2~~TRINITY_DN16220_c0_g2_i1.p1  ORF type:complete len:136 (-),score=5.63 TRINITY_DN16220_c0_g2_i1:107-514(-)
MSIAFHWRLSRACRASLGSIQAPVNLPILSAISLKGSSRSLQLCKASSKFTMMRLHFTPIMYGSTGLSNAVYSSIDDTARIGEVQGERGISDVIEAASKTGETSGLEEGGEGGVETVGDCGKGSELIRGSCREDE